MFKYLVPPLMAVALGACGTSASPSPVSIGPSSVRDAGGSGNGSDASAPLAPMHDGGAGGTLGGTGTTDLGMDGGAVVGNGQRDAGAGPPRDDGGAGAQADGGAPALCPAPEAQLTHDAYAQFSLTFDSQHGYYVSVGGNPSFYGIYRFPKSGGPASRIGQYPSDEFLDAQQLAADADHVYFNDEGAATVPRPGAIYAIDKRTLSVSKLADATDTHCNAGHPAAVLVDDHNVYFIEQLGFPQGQTSSPPGCSSAPAANFVAVPKSGGPSKILATAPYFRVPVQDNDALYVLNGAELWRVAKADGSVTKLSLNISAAPGLVAVDDTTVYVIDANSTTIYALPKMGGPSSTIRPFTDRGGSEDVLLVDATQIYFTTEFGGTLWSIPKTGGAVQHLADAHSRIWSAVIDGPYLYRADVEVYRACR